MNKSSKKKTCFVCRSKFHLIKDCDYYEQRTGVNVNAQPFVPKTYSRNIPAGKSVSSGKSVSADRPVPTDKSVSADVPNAAGKPVSAGKPVAASKTFPPQWKRHGTNQVVRPHRNYVQTDYWPHYYGMGYGFWDAVKPSAGCYWPPMRPLWANDNSGSYQSTWHQSYDPQGRLKSAMT